MRRNFCCCLQSLVIPLILIGTALELSAQGIVQESAHIHYTVSIPEPASESFLVTADIYGIVPDTMTYYFPVWAPGAYDIVNFGKYVSEFSATSGNGSSLEVIRQDFNTLKVVSPSAHVRLQYTVQDIENLDNSAWFGLSDIEDSTEVAFAVGTALFGYPAGYTDIPYTVTYTPPSGWNLAVALDPVEGETHTYRASSYDELVDAPVQMGDFQLFEFMVDGIPHLITVKSPEPLEPEVGTELVQTTKDVVEMMSEFFGEIPYKRYLFQVFLKVPERSDRGYGALEHANSSTYLMPYFTQRTISDMLEPVLAHEYWHLWSPKRIHVDKLGPFDYQQVPQTSSLWFHEGLTEYYARMLLVRHRLRTPDDFLLTFGNFVDGGYGRVQREPITKLSRELATRQLEEIISLYTKGPLLGLLLDTEIRVHTQNRKSLDDVFQLFNKEYGDHPGAKNFDDDDIIPIMERATGASLVDFYTKYIAGTEELPVEAMLKKIGIRLMVVPDFGARLRTVPGGAWEILYVHKSGTVPASGLKKGDQLLGIQVGDGRMQPVDSLEVRPSSITRWLGEKAAQGTPVSVLCISEGEKKVVPLKMQWEFRRLEIDPAATEEAKALRVSMLGF